MYAYKQKNRNLKNVYDLLSNKQELKMITIMLFLLIHHNIRFILSIDK